MTQYDKNFNLPVVIPPESMANILANVMGGLNMRNLRVAETEKYAHVTYFFNGGVEQPFPGEDRVMVPSPKVATYDLKPEMSAAGIAEAVVKATNDGTFDVIIVNFANADMVGHSGKIEPTIKAVETVDACNRRAAHSAHHESCALHRDGRRCQAIHFEAERIVAGHFADHARNARHHGAKRNDGQRSSGKKELTLGAA